MQDTEKCQPFGNKKYLQLFTKEKKSKNKNIYLKRQQFTTGRAQLNEKHWIIIILFPFWRRELRIV